MQALYIRSHNGLVMNMAPLASDLNLVLQVVILILLFVGFKFGRTKTTQSLDRHQVLMRLMVILNLIGAFTVMIPAFVGGFAIVVAEPSKIGFPLTSVHSVFGSISVLLGIVLAFRKFGNVRLWMRFTFVMWLITLILGLSVYVRYYVLTAPT